MTPGYRPAPPSPRLLVSTPGPRGHARSRNTHGALVTRTYTLTYIHTHTQARTRASVRTHARTHAHTDPRAHARARAPRGLGTASLACRSRGATGASVRPSVRACAHSSFFSSGTGSAAFLPIGMAAFTLRTRAGERERQSDAARETARRSERRGH